MQRLCHNTRRYENRAHGTLRKTSSGEPGWSGDTWGCGFRPRIMPRAGEIWPIPRCSPESCRTGAAIISMYPAGAWCRTRVSPWGRGYQVPYAARIRPAVGMVTMAVGMISQPRRAEKIIARGRMRCEVMHRLEWVEVGPDGISVSSTWCGGPGARLGREAPVLAAEPRWECPRRLLYHLWRRFKRTRSPEPRSTRVGGTGVWAGTAA